MLLSFMGVGVGNKALKVMWICKFQVEEGAHIPLSKQLVFWFFVLQSELPHKEWKAIEISPGRGCHQLATISCAFLQLSVPARIPSGSLLLRC